MTLPATINRHRRRNQHLLPCRLGLGLDPDAALPCRARSESGTAGRSADEASAVANTSRRCSYPQGARPVAARRVFIDWVGSACSRRPGALARRRMTRRVTPLFVTWAAPAWAARTRATNFLCEDRAPENRTPRSPESRRALDHRDHRHRRAEARRRSSSKSWRPACCHTDAYTLSGLDPEEHLPGDPRPEGAGIVREIGAGVTTLKVGDHVIPLYTPECQDPEFSSFGEKGPFGTLLVEQQSKVAGKFLEFAEEDSRLQPRPICAEFRCVTKPLSLPISVYDRTVFF